tara:strand:+ start:171 stop:722 length:552 start_codon:yes stop_codon:yes gene_type:complete
MSNDVQRLHDAVLKLGDAALEIAEALSAFKDEELEGGEFKRPGDPKPAPTSMNIKAGEALTPERFQKLVTSVDEPPPPPVAKSYATGSVLSPARAQARKRASQRAANAGYDYEHWCKRVREVRVKIGVGARGLGDLLGVTPSGVQNWETGVCFAKGETRAHLERVSAHLCGATHASWRKPKCD